MMKTQLYKDLVQTICGNLQWDFHDSLGQYLCYERIGEERSFKLGYSSAKDVFLIIWDKGQKMIYEGDTAVIQDEEEKEILRALIKTVNMLYRNPDNDKDASFY